MKISEIDPTEVDTFQNKQIITEMNENNINENSIQSNPTIKNYSEVLLAPENNTSSSNMNLNTPILTQPQVSPTHSPNTEPTTQFQQAYISSFTNVNPTRNIWIKRSTDIDATKIPFSGEDVHDLKVSILQFFGPSFIGSSAELGFVTVWKGSKKLLPGQVIDSDLLQGVTCESPLLLKNTHGQTSNSPTSELLEFDANKTINLESNDENSLIKQGKESKKSKVNSITLNDVNNLALNNLGISNVNGMNNINLLNQLAGGNSGNTNPATLRQLNNLNNLAQLNQFGGINGLSHLNVTTSNASTSIQSISTLAPLNNTLVNFNSIQTTAASLNPSTSSPLNTTLGMNNIINGLVSLQNFNNARSLTTSTFNDSLSIPASSNTDKINTNIPLATVVNNNSIPSLQDPIRSRSQSPIQNQNQNQNNNVNTNSILNVNTKVESPAPDDQNNSQHSDNEEPIDPEEQLNAIYPPCLDIPKEIEDAVQRNTNRGWRLITIIDTNDIPKFFEDQPQDWRVQRSATDRYPGYLIINYIGGLEGERNNMPSKALNLTWSPETNDPTSKMYRKAKDLIDKQSMMYGSRFFCKGYPWCPSIVSSLNSVDAETTDISSKNGKKLAKKLKTSLTHSASVNTSSPPPEGVGLFRNSNGGLLIDGQSNSMKRNFDCMRLGGRSRSMMSDDGKNDSSSQNQRSSLKVSCNATLKIEIYASNLKKAVIYGKNLHGILGPISEFRPSDRIMSEACRAALSKDITYTRFLRQAEAMAIKYNIPKHRIPNRTQIRTFFERSRRGNRLSGYASNSESPSTTNTPLTASNTSRALLNSSLVSNMHAISLLNQQRTSHPTPSSTQDSTNYSSIATASTKIPTTNPNQIQIPSHSPLSTYQATSLPATSLIDSVDNVNVDMYNNNDLGIIKITPDFNSMNSIGFNSGLSGITASIANDLTTGINTSIFTHTSSTNSSNTNNNNTNFHSTLFNS